MCQTLQIYCNTPSQLLEPKLHTEAMMMTGENIDLNTMDIIPLHIKKSSSVIVDIERLYQDRENCSQEMLQSIENDDFFALDADNERLFIFKRSDFDTIARFMDQLGSLIDLVCLAEDSSLYTMKIVTNDKPCGRSLHDSTKKQFMEAMQDVRHETLELGLLFEKYEWEE